MSSNSPSSLVVLKILIGRFLLYSNRTNISQNINFPNLLFTSPNYYWTIHFILLYLFSWGGPNMKSYIFSLIPLLTQCGHIISNFVSPLIFFLKKFWWVLPFLPLICIFFTILLYSNLFSCVKASIVSTKKLWVWNHSRTCCTKKQSPFFWFPII